MRGGKNNFYGAFFGVADGEMTAAYPRELHLSMSEMPLK